VPRRQLEFGCAVILVGLLAGIAGGMTTLLLHWVEHATFDYTFGTLLEGVSAASPLRRVAGPVVGGALAGTGWWLLRRHTDVPALAPTIKAHKPIPHLALSLDAALQVLLVGSGASLGREGAPRQFAAALSDATTARWTLTPRDREILLSCAAGAGLAAVYSVPLGGALFAARILLSSWHPRVLGTALITSSLAVAVAAPVTHNEVVLRWPGPQYLPLFGALTVVLAPLMAVTGLAFNRLMERARPASQIRSAWMILAISVAGLTIGLCSLRWAELPGNGRSILTVSLDGSMTLTSAAALLVLKPLLTALFLRAGAVGGMLTPALATGAALGSMVALAISALTGQPVSVPTVSLACATGVLAITQRAPLWAALFVWELSRPPWWLLIVFAAAASAAHGLRVFAEGRR
jgi:H+/Cl- antiporter ClcA